MAITPTKVTAGSALAAQLWGENPIFRQVLGICSTLAVTNLMFNTLLMCLGLVWATVLSNATLSALRAYTPARVRMIVQVLIISVYVIIVDIAIRAWYPDIHRIIGPYVGLIITNCIIMGRLEAFAMKNPVMASIGDGLGAGVGYSFILLAIAFVREGMGFGTWFGYPIPGRDVWFHSWTIMVMPPGAFFLLALAVWAARYYDERCLAAEAAAEKAKEARP